MKMAAPPHRVYELIADAHARSTWLPELHAVSGAPDRELREGDRFVGVASLLGHRFVGNSEVVEATPGHRIAEEVVIGARFRTAWTVTTDTDGSCRVSHDIDVEFPQGPFGRLERWVLTRVLDRLQRQGLKRLAQQASAAAR